MDARMPSRRIYPAPIARIAGALWLVSIVAGIYAEVFVRGSMIVHGNAAATASRIMTGEAVFREGIAADLVGDMAYLGATLLLYVLLRPAGRAMPLVMAGFGVAGSAVMAVNLVNLYGPIVLLHTGGHLGNFPTELTPLVLVFVRMHSVGYSISIALFSVQIATMGLVILRSTFFPRLFGLLFIIEAACKFISSFGGFLDIGWVDRLGTYILLPGLLAEGGFTFWLLAFGLNVERWGAVLPDAVSSVSGRSDRTTVGAR